jgi:hypothetical protein
VLLEQFRTTYSENGRYSRDIESVSVCIRGICITCDGILEYHLEMNKKVGMGGTTEAMQRVVLSFIARSFPAIFNAMYRLTFNESVLTFRIWRWVYLSGTCSCAARIILRGVFVTAPHQSAEPCQAPRAGFHNGLKRK